MAVVALTTTECKGTAFDDSQRPNAYTKINEIITALNALTATVGVATITDPGDGLAIPVTVSGQCALVSAGAETRTLAVPTYDGQRLQLVCKTYVGDIVVTVAAAIDTVPGSTIITFGNAGDFIELVGTTVGANKRWRVVTNSGCALT